MAHRTDVVQVPKDFATQTTPEQVTDPACGKSFSRKEARHVFFGANETLYFCSRECLDKHRTKRSAQKPAA